MFSSTKFKWNTRMTSYFLCLFWVVRRFRKVLQGTLLLNRVVAPHPPPDDGVWCESSDLWQFWNSSSILHHSYHCSPLSLETVNLPFTFKSSVACGLPRAHTSLPSCSCRGGGAGQELVDCYSHEGGIKRKLQQLLLFLIYSKLAETESWFLWVFFTQP